MNEIVKYSNAMNELDFKGFCEHDLDLLMALCARLKNMGDTVQVFDYSYLMDLIGWDRRQRVDLFHMELMRMASKLRLVGAALILNEDNDFSVFNLFQEFEGKRKQQTLTVRVNPRFTFILNNLGSQFTRFELKEYIGLDGKYAKLIYQHLKQYRKTGWWEISTSDIRRELSIPDSYKNIHIMDKVIKPNIDILRSCKGFGDLTVEAIRGTGRGRAIEKYRFRWTAENQIPGQSTLDEASEEMQKYKAAKASTKTKTKKNSFTDFEQREIDYDSLERQLLMQQLGETSEKK